MVLDPSNVICIPPHYASKFPQETDSDRIDYSAVILDAVKKASRACGELVKYTIAAYEDLIPAKEKGRTGGDQQWSQAVLNAVSQ